MIGTEVQYTVRTYLPERRKILWCDVPGRKRYCLQGFCGCVLTLCANAQCTLSSSAWYQTKVALLHNLDTVCAHQNRSATRRTKGMHCHAAGGRA